MIVRHGRVGGCSQRGSGIGPQRTELADRTLRRISLHVNPIAAIARSSPISDGTPVVGQSLWRRAVCRLWAAKFEGLDSRTDFAFEARQRDDVPSGHQSSSERRRAHRLANVATGQVENCCMSVSPIRFLSSPRNCCGCAASVFACHRIIPIGGLVPTRGENQATGLHRAGENWLFRRRAAPC